MDSAFNDIVAQLRQRTSVASVSISETTELFHDLRLSGDDLYEFLLWLRQRYRVDLSKLNLSDYSPPEGVALADRKYKSLSVGRLVNAIQAGEWRDV